MGEKKTLVFSQDWFEITRPTWEKLFLLGQPSRVLEVGSYEGASACFSIRQVASFRPLEIHCVDTWEGGIDHQEAGVDMVSVYERFQSNTANMIAGMPHPVQLTVHKGYSDIELAKLFAEGKSNYFDFIYIDGSHQAPDVLADAVLGFKLLKVGGIMGFDDYLWQEELPYGRDPLRTPKIAIDAFTNIYCRKIEFLDAPCVQVYFRKLAE